MTSEEIAEQSRLAEGRYIAASSRNSPNRLELLERADRWQRALDAALALEAAVAEAERCDRTSGDPPDGAGFPDVPSSEASCS